MGGWVTVQRTQFVHQDDKCPGNCPSDSAGSTCVSYNASTQDIASCVGHRNLDAQRNLPADIDSRAGFKNYGPGDTIKHNHENRLRNVLARFNLDIFLNELARRRQHKWYQSSLPSLDRPGVSPGDFIKHEQENVINDCISALNNVILTVNGSGDYGLSHDRSNVVSSHKVLSGDVISAENLKYLERNVMASYRDCICYSDCTSHGLSVYTEQYWCSTYGSGGSSGGGWY